MANLAATVKTADRLVAADRLTAAVAAAVAASARARLHTAGTTATNACKLAVHAIGRSPCKSFVWLLDILVYLNRSVQTIEPHIYCLHLGFTGALLQLCDEDINIETDYIIKVRLN